jgi:acyl carrier protein
MGAQFLSQTLYGVELSWRARLGRRVRIGHLGGVVIAPTAVVGDDCLIRQNVTIGAVVDGGRSPRIGNRVEFGSGAVVVGDIQIGDDVLIGPNTVVTTDVPAGAKVLASPPRIILRDGETPQPVAGNARHASPEAVVAIIDRAVGLDAVVDPDVPLLSSGLIDSLNLVAVLDALEAVYGVAIPAEAVEAESFDTARQISDYLRACAD